MMIKFNMYIYRITKNPEHKKLMLKKAGEDTDSLTTEWMGKSEGDTKQV